MDKIKAKEESGFNLVRNPFMVKLQKLCKIINDNFTQ